VVGNGRFRVWWITLILFHATLVFFSGLLPEINPVQNSLPAFNNNPDKTLNTCILQWNLNTIKGKWELGIFDAPIFSPCRLTKFFSEHLLGHLIYAYPVSLFTSKHRIILGYPHRPPSDLASEKPAWIARIEFFFAYLRRSCQRQEWASQNAFRASGQFFLQEVLQKLQSGGVFRGPFSRIGG
jgi:hypothetical protein